MPPRKRRRRGRRWLLAAAAAAALALLLFWPWGGAPPEAGVESSRTASAAVVPKPAPAARPVARPAPPRPQTNLPEREALLAAVRERSSSLRDCSAGALTRLPLRLHVARSGAMRAVEITGDAPPASVASCVRKKAMGWSFEKLRLPSDMELLVAISFAPGA